jgi:hypothetical protein
MEENFKFGFGERLALAGIIIGVAGAAASWVVPQSLPEWLLEAGIQPDYIFIACVVLVACAVVFFLIDFSVYLLAKFGVRRAMALVIVGTAFIILGGVIGMYGAFKTDHPSKYASASGPRPILKLAFEKRDIPIRWPDADLFPHTEDQQPQRPPLILKIQNVGSLKAIDVEVSFAVADEQEKLRADLQASVFKQLDQRQDDSWEIPLEFLSGKPSRTIGVSLHGANVRRISVLGGEESIAYPPIIQNWFWLRTIQQAYVASGLVEAKNREIANSGKSAEEMMAYFSKRRLPTIIVLPEVSLNISYKDQNGKPYQQREKVKTVYIPVVPPFWAIENEGKFLFHAGFGLLGFEDADNPDDGFFSLAKRHGLVE